MVMKEYITQFFHSFWTGQAQRNIMYQAWATQIILFVGLVHCWLFVNKKNIGYCQPYHLTRKKI